MNESPPPLPSERRAVPLRSFIIGLLVAIALTSMFWNAIYFWRKTPEVSAGPLLGLRVECPEKTKMGDTFDLKVVLANAGQKELMIATVEFDDSLVKGMTIGSITPEPYGRAEDRSVTWYKFARPIGAGKTVEFVFQLEAKTKGAFKGDVEIYDPTDALLAKVVVSTSVE